MPFVPSIRLVCPDTVNVSPFNTASHDPVTSTVILPSSGFGRLISCAPPHPAKIVTAVIMITNNKTSFFFIPVLFAPFAKTPPNSIVKTPRDVKFFPRQTIPIRRFSFPRCQARKDSMPPFQHFRVSHARIKSNSCLQPHVAKLTVRVSPLSS